MLWFYPVFLSPGDRRWVPLFAATAGGMWRRSQSRATLWHWQSLQGCLWSLMSVAFGRSLPQTLSMLRIAGTMLSLQIVKSWASFWSTFTVTLLFHASAWSSYAGWKCPRVSNPDSVVFAIDWTLTRAVCKSLGSLGLPSNILWDKTATWRIWFHLIKIRDHL